MWTAPFGKPFFHVLNALAGFAHMSGLFAWRLMSTGPDEVRRPGSRSCGRDPGLSRFCGLCLSSVATAAFITLFHACQTRMARTLLDDSFSDDSCLFFPDRARASRLREDVGAERLAVPHHRPDDPRQLVGQRHRDHARRLARPQRLDPVGQSARAMATTAVEMMTPNPGAPSSNWLVWHVA